MRKYIIALAFLIITVVSMIPLFRYFNSGIPFAVYADVHKVIKVYQSDSLQIYYFLWLLKEATLGHIPWFVDPYTFCVSDVSHYIGFMMLPYSALSIPFSLLFSVAAGYNVLVVLSFLLCGFFSYRLFYLYSEDRFAAFIGAVIFTFFPYHRAKTFGGQFSGFLLFYAPLVVYYIELGFLRAKWIYPLISAVALLTLYFMEIQLLYYLFLFLLFYIPLRVAIYLFSEDGRFKEVVRVLLPFSIAMIVIVLYIYITSKHSFAGTRIHGGRSLFEILLYSPHWQDFFIRIQHFYERYIYIGAITLPLAFIALTSRKKKALVLMYFLLAVLFSILSLGPTLKTFPLYKAFYKYVPYFNMSRSPGKLIFDAFLCISVLATIGFRELKRFVSAIYGKRVSFIAAIAVFGLLLVDYFPPYSIAITYLPGGNRIHRIIRESIGSKKMLEVSFWPGDSSVSSIYLYDVTLTRARMINGYAPVVSRHYFDDIFLPLETVNMGRLDMKQYRLLKELGVKYIVVHADAFPPKVSVYPVSFTIRRFRSSPYLRFLDYDDNMWLFEVRDEPVKIDDKRIFSIVGKCYEAEYSPRRVGRVVRDRAASNGMAVYAQKGKDRKGYEVFGPYRMFPEGSYNAVFRLKVDDNKVSDVVAVIDVVTDRGKTVIFEKKLKGTDFKAAARYQLFRCTFELKKPETIELRVYFTGKAGLWVDYRYVLPSCLEDPYMGVIEAERLFHRAGVVVKDKDASGGEAIYLTSRWDHDIYPTAGPYRWYPSGSYVATFRLKVEKMTDKKVARLEVTDGFIKFEKTLYGADFRQVGSYEEFLLPFVLKDQRILQFRMYFYGNTNIYFDRVRIGR